MVCTGDKVRADNGEIVDVWSLEWKDVDHAYDWYNRYATIKGFSIRKHTGFKHRHGYWTSKAFVCSKEGMKIKKDLLVPVKRERQNTRCRCLASITVQRQLSGKYCIFEWCSQHNHELATPSKVHMLRSQRHMSELQCAEAIDSDRAGIRPKLVHDLMVVQAGGRQHVGFTHQDYKSYLNGIRTKIIEVGEVGVLVNWFGDQLKKDSEFFFLVMKDEEEHITSIFWLDHSMQNNFAI